MESLKGLPETIAHMAGLKEPSSSAKRGVYLLMPKSHDGIIKKIKNLRCWVFFENKWQDGSKVAYITAYKSTSLTIPTILKEAV